MKRNSNKAFSLIEMQVSLLIASILVLAVGALASMSTKSYNKIQSQAAIYNDVTYSLKMIQNKVRSSIAAPTVDVSKNPSIWLDGKQLVIDQGAFGVYKTIDSPVREFVYLNDKNNETNREVLFRFEKNEDELMFSPSSTASECSSLMVKFKGTKDKIPFDLSSCIVRRIG